MEGPWKASDRALAKEGVRAADLGGELLARLA